MPRAHTIPGTPEHLSYGFDENGEHLSNPIALEPDVTTGIEGWGGIAGGEYGQRSRVDHAHEGVHTSQRPMVTGSQGWSPPQGMSRD